MRRQRGSKGSTQGTQRAGLQFTGASGRVRDPLLHEIIGLDIDPERFPRHHVEGMVDRRLTDGPRIAAPGRRLSGPEVIALFDFPT